jgi:hypothetical protein
VKVCIWSVVHLILTANSEFLSPLMFIPFFFHPPVLPPTFKPFIPASACASSPSLSMPATPPGPWALEKVKQRLRREQVEREEAASARYRRQEDKPKGNSSASQCSVLLVLTLSCLLLSLAVLLLSSVVLRIAK